MDLNNKKFHTKENIVGLSSGETTFQYFQDGDVITGHYSGGKILQGSLIGKKTSATEIELLYHCLTTDGELLAGQSSGTVSVNTDNLLEIKYDWQWLNGNKTGGKSHYLEFK
ncbi:MAG: hypothetical protein AAF840_03855 [Bacteroidota bacterium]